MLEGGGGRGRNIVVSPDAGKCGIEFHRNLKSASIPWADRARREGKNAGKGIRLGDRIARPTS